MLSSSANTAHEAPSYTYPYSLGVIKFTTLSNPPPNVFKTQPIAYMSITSIPRTFSSKISAKTEGKKTNKEKVSSSNQSTTKVVDPQADASRPNENPQQIKPKEKTQSDDQSTVSDSEKTIDPCPPWQNPIHHNDPNLDKIMLEDFKNGETPTLVPLPPFDPGDGRVVAAPHLHLIADEIVNMSMLEVKELTDRLAEHFGIEDDGGTDDMGLVGADAGGETKPAEEEQKEEKKTFDVKLVSYDEKSKIKVIKEIRAITNLGLKEAKELVEGSPKVVKKDVKKEEADEIKNKLVAAGATVEIA
jgi:large subunit ribosomal protein L7/L12